MVTKKTSVAVLLIFSTSALFGQAPPDYSAVCKEEMKKLSALNGKWKGEAIYKRGQNPEIKIDQEEDIAFGLDGTLLIIEGIGRDSNGTIVFNAMGIVNYDAINKDFKFKSYLKEGRSTEAYFNVPAKNKYEWGFDIPGGGKSKYTITLDTTQQTWYEKGEYTRDGNNWFTFVELNLKKLP